MPSELVRAMQCEMNPGILDENGQPTAPTTNIYVDDALLTCVGRWRMEKALAATIEAIFVVMGPPKTEVHQNPLAIDKWIELIVGPQQIMLGLDIRTPWILGSLQNTLPRCANCSTLNGAASKTLCSDSLEKLQG